MSLYGLGYILPSTLTASLVERDPFLVRIVEVAPVGELNPKTQLQLRQLEPSHAYSKAAAKLKKQTESRACYIYLCNRDMDNHTKYASSFNIGDPVQTPKKRND